LSSFLFLEHVAICLFTGELVDYSVDRKSPNYIPIVDYVHEKGFSGAVYFLAVSGNEISHHFIFFTKNDQLLLFPPLYLEKFGFPDSGLENHGELYLNQDKIKCVIEWLLSGSWMANIS
jgi:hypothetical protein